MQKEYNVTKPFIGGRAKGKEVLRAKKNEERCSEVLPRQTEEPINKATKGYCQQERPREKELRGPRKKEEPREKEEIREAGT